MFLRALSSIVVLGLLAGCAAETDADEASVEAANTESVFAPPVLPHRGGSGDLSPWGGTDASRWRPEATLANAVSATLNEVWARPSTRDVVVAVPLRMWKSDHHPYGDGQSNAVPSFEGFPAKDRPPVVATFVTAKDASGSRSSVAFRLDRALGSTTTIEIAYFAADGHMNKVDVGGHIDGAGDVVAEWTPPFEVTLASDVAFAVHPKGWNDWFPITFQHRAVRATALDAAQVRFSDGRGLLDRERIANANASTSPFERLTSHTFSASYNGVSHGHPTPYTPSDIHGRFPYYNRPIVTAIGSGFMWVADERPAGYKSLYACFTGRRAAEEATAPDGGVASGSGWHHIGDPTETIVNDLERTPVLVGYAKGNPFSASALPHGGFAWGLGDVATFRFLRPGEAFVTPRGSSAQPAYHAFLFAQKANACLELLTHPE